MAIVRITERLQRQVHDRIRNLYAIRESKLREEVLARIGDIYNIFVPQKFQVYMAEMGQEWLEINPNLAFSIDEISYHLKFPGGSLGIPNKFCSTWSPYVITPETPVDPDLRTFLTENSRKIRELNAEMVTLLDSVENMLSSYPTLKRVVEAWPGILELLPADVLEKHYATSVIKKGFNASEAPVLSDEAKIALIKTNMLVGKGEIVHGNG